MACADPIGRVRGRVNHTIDLFAVLQSLRWLAVGAIRFNGSTLNELVQTEIHKRFAGDGLSLYMNDLARWSRPRVGNSNQHRPFYACIALANGHSYRNIRYAACVDLNAQAPAVRWVASLEETDGVAEYARNGGSGQPISTRHGSQEHPQIQGNGLLARALQTCLKNPSPGRIRVSSPTALAVAYTFVRTSGGRILDAESKQPIDDRSALEAPPQRVVIALS